MVNEPFDQTIHSGLCRTHHVPLKQTGRQGFPRRPVCRHNERSVYQLVNFLTTATVANTRPTMRPKSEIMERAVGATGNRMPITRVKSELSKSRKASRAACRFAGIVIGVGHLQERRTIETPGPWGQD